MKTYVYVDAFNLYFGSLKHTPHKWLDLSRLCDLLLPKHQILCINTDFHTDKQALLSAKRVRGDHMGAIFKRL
jgi:hypothetical protein